MMEAGKSYRSLVSPVRREVCRFVCRGNDGGFTLLDNLITLSIMMFTMMALIGLLGAVINANATNKKRTTAITLAENKIAEVRRKGYDSTVPATVTEAYNTITGYPAYKRVTVTQTGVPATGMQTITVTVYWHADTKQARKSTQVAQ
jgi:type II secretory pathway pseudopilin PulG